MYDFTGCDVDILCEYCVNRGTVICKFCGGSVEEGEDEASLNVRLSF
ncbi:MAG: hypothetical protein ABH834_08340 [Candidatus Altiarchaeota archaeon]